MDRERNIEKNSYTPVDISTFFGKEEEQEFEKKYELGIVVFTPKQKEMTEALFDKIKVTDPDRYEVFQKRISDLRNLAVSIANFPSLLERHELTGGERTRQSLIDSLIDHQDRGDYILQLPSKASLGKGFLVAKIHTFSSLYKVARNIKEQEDVIQYFQTETITMMFSLLAEDIYLNLIQDKSIPLDFRREIAMSLLLLWEHRSDQSISYIAPVLQSVWTARRKLAPAFGTMMGTSELMLISMQLDDQWTSFIRAMLKDPGVSQAMEEFLFGISFEQILKLRSILRTRGIAAIGRDEVSAFLGTHIKSDAGLDYRDFYSMYTIRRDNARARERMGLPGPHKTLEDYFIRYVMELDKEKQSNDSFAK